MVDAYHVEVLVVAQFQLAILSCPSRGALDVKPKPLIVAVAVLLLECPTDGEFDGRAVVVPLELVEVVPDERTERVALGATAPVPRYGWFLRDGLALRVVELVEEFEERLPGVAVLAFELVERAAADDGDVFFRNSRTGASQTLSPSVK